MAALALGLVSAAIQARVLGPVGRGELALAMVPGTLLAMLLCFGLPDYFARRAAQGTDPSELSKLAALLSIGIALVFAAPYAVLAEFQSPVGSDAWWILLLYAIGVPIFVYGYSLTGILLGAGSWKLVAALRVAPLVLIVVGLTVIALFVNAPTPLTVGILLVTVSALGPLGSLVKPELRPRGSISWTMAREALGFGLRGWFAGAVALLNQRIDLLLVTFIASAGGIGLYAVSTSLAAVLAGIANAIAMPARNKVTRGERHGVATAVSLTMLIAVTVATAVTLCLPMLIHVVLGDQFLAAAPVMTVLLFAQVPLAVPYRRRTPRLSLRR